VRFLRYKEDRSATRRRAKAVGLRRREATDAEECGGRSMEGRIASFDCAAIVVVERGEARLMAGEIAVGVEVG
jgi:hypothetical protein